MRAFKLNFVHERGGSSVASFGICTGSDRADSLDCASSITFISEKVGSKITGNKKTPRVFYKHICFLCARSYEEVKTGSCQYVHDHSTVSAVNTVHLLD